MLERDEIIFQGEENGMEIAFSDLSWNPTRERRLLSEMREETSELLFPNQKSFRMITKDISKQIPVDVKKEIMLYQELEKEYGVSGINYQKLNLQKPSAVFNHFAPRSLMSLLHLIVSSDETKS